ncbi:MAG: hypothetical protein KDD70_02295 [Bdellovibrionales bacterium]|nr:hypothetical protein [Bdellovibrionales bacterium]
MGKEQRDWGALIREQIASGESQARFCKERGISLASFQYHKSRGADEAKESNNFVPIVREESETRIELRYNGGVSLLFPLSVSGERLSELVRCLSSK